MIKKILVLIGTVTLMSFAQADVLGVYAGVGTWKSGAKGSFGDTEAIDVDELGVDSDDVDWLFIALEHPIPMLPNVRISKSDLEASGSITLANDVTFDGQVFPSGTASNSAVDLSHTDVSLYYELLDTIASVDLGLTLRKFDGEAAISSATLSESVSFDVTLPMLYARAQFDLPLTGFYVGGTMKYVGFDGDNLQDFEARVGYMTSDLPANVGVELGYRELSIEAEDGDLGTDLTFDGTYAAIVFHF